MTLVKIIKENESFKAIDLKGNTVPFNKSIPGQPTIYWGTAQSWYEGGYAFKLKNEKWEKVPAAEYDKAINKKEVPSALPKEQQELMQFINSSYNLKPDVLKLSELKWKYLMRSIMRGKNIMMTGPSGCGKTDATFKAASYLERKVHYFNLGATQDPRSTLIGNTHYNKDSGTYFSESLFVNAIQQENAVILLDELSRAHPEAWNILMTVLDPIQRYLRLDEKDDSPTIKVANGVSFIATANIGMEYTATRVIDRAILDRFSLIEMDVLSEDDEYTLLKGKFPTINENTLLSLCSIVGDIRKETNTDSPRISTIVSTRNTIEIAELIIDGFSIHDAAELLIYPLFPNDGNDSERVFVKQLIQKYVGSKSKKQLFDINELEN